MYDFQLRVEPFLYAFYAVMAIYGYFSWKRENVENEKHELIELGLSKHIAVVFLGMLGSFGLGWIFDNFSNGERTYLDAFTSSFAVLATFLQIYKVRSNFIYWIVINSATIYLYAIQGLKHYVWLMVIYLIMSIIGWLKWKEK